MTVVSHFFWSWYIFRKRVWVWIFAGAAIAPDVPYAVLLAYYSGRFTVNGFADLTAWDLAWRSPIVCALHSFVPWLLVATGVSAGVGSARRRALLPLWGGWLSHIIVDMLTHRSDGYPIFYPLSAYHFPTPISYWEPAYHGSAFMLVESLLMVAAMVHYVTTRRRTGWRRRSTVVGSFQTKTVEPAEYVENRSP